MARGATTSRNSSAAARRAIEIRNENREIMFTDEDIKPVENLYGLERGPNYIEVVCGCTSKKYGDSVGKLRISSTGQFSITCQCLSSSCNEGTHSNLSDSLIWYRRGTCLKPWICIPTCIISRSVCASSCPSTERSTDRKIMGVLQERGKLTPDEFEKHSKEGGPRKWKSNIWVTMDEDGQKVPLWKTGLMKFYRHASNEGQLGSTIRRQWNLHRDELLRCFKCKKERRFRLRTKEECRAFHNASRNRRWKCADHPHDIIKCSDEEERGCRRSGRGCPRASTCQGCTSCVCLGCLNCRYWDCNCRTCIDFMHNAKP